MNVEINLTKALSQVLLGLLLTSSGMAQESTSDSRQEERLKEEEAIDYYKKWLKEDVVYIITEEEEHVFLKLQTDDEKEQFIEQFWFRRDPDPRSAGNEFKEEHYQRIAYANEHFFSAKAGWRTDRGKTHIMFGPPDDREMNPSGGRYERMLYEGGGTTVTYPFERWLYRHIPGVGSEIEIEFVDKTGTGEYRIAMDHWEKDALMFSGGGETLAEMTGLNNRSDRPYFNPSSASSPAYYSVAGTRAKDLPFQRMKRYFELQKAPLIKYKDLKSLVESRISYETIPFTAVSSHVRLDERRALVSVNVEIQNKHLTFKKQYGVHDAAVHIYGIVQGLTGRIISEFDDALAMEYSTDQLSKGLTQQGIYQKQLLLPTGAYKMTVIVKDVHSGNLGSLETRLVAPEYEKDGLSTSSLILARSVRQLQELPDSLEMFVLGDLKVVPNVSATSRRDDSLPVYLQIYGLKFDQSVERPVLDIDYSLLRDGKVVKTISDGESRSLVYFSEERAVLVKNLSLEGLPEGRYVLEVKVRDGVSDSSVVGREKFKIVSSPS